MLRIRPWGRSPKLSSHREILRSSPKMSRRTAGCEQPLVQPGLRRRAPVPHLRLRPQPHRRLAVFSLFPVGKFQARGPALFSVCIFAHRPQSPRIQGQREHNTTGASHLRRLPLLRGEQKGLRRLGRQAGWTLSKLAHRPDRDGGPEGGE